MQNQVQVQVPEEVCALLLKDREGSMSPVDRTKMLDECKKRGIPVQSFDFSNIKVDGVSRYDAGTWLIELTRMKAFEMLRTEFGSCARFNVGPAPFDFFWRKARWAMVIGRPLMRRRFLLDEKMKRSPRFEDYEEFQNIPKNVRFLYTPYYRIWHNPSEVLREVRAKLIASQAYSRLSS